MKNEASKPIKPFTIDLVFGPNDALRVGDATRLTHLEATFSDGLLAWLKADAASVDEQRTNLLLESYVGAHERTGWHRDHCSRLLRFGMPWAGGVVEVWARAEANQNDRVHFELAGVHN